jgi:uncharacterized membrane protein YkoI
MLKKVLTGTGIAAALAGMFLLGSLVITPVFAQTPANTAATQAAVQSSSTGSVEEQQPQYTGSITVDESQYSGVNEADEAAALQAKATITSAQAEAAALAANPGTTAIKAELDNENGALVYSVELSNGMDVKVDAANGEILHTEQAGNDATEVAGAENAPGQEAIED